MRSVDEFLRENVRVIYIYMHAFNVMTRPDTFG